MLDAIKGRRERDDEGFTLIELMVVLLIIAILMAIAIPTFLGARNTANARASQSNLTNALTAEQTYWTNNQGFTAVSTTLTGIESSLAWTTSAPAQGGNAVAVSVSSATAPALPQIVELQAYSKDGNCYAILQSNDPAGSYTYYSKTTGACTVPTNAVAPTSVLTSGTPVAGDAITTGSASSGVSGVWYPSF